MAHVQRKVRTDGAVRYEVRWTERVRNAAGQTTEVRHRQKSFPTAKAARQFKPLHEADTLRGDLRDYDAAQLPLAHYAERWLSALRTEVKARTYEGYEQVLRKHVLPALGNRPVASITVSDVRDFKDALLRRGLSASGARYAYGPLRRSLDIAVEDKAIRLNPAQHVSIPTDAKLGRARFRAHFLNEHEVDALTAALASADRAPYDTVVRVLAWTGLRAGELAGLNIADAHLWHFHPGGWGGYLDVHPTRRKIKGGWGTDTPKSERSTRRVALQDWLAEDLHAYLSTHPRGDDPQSPLFPGRKRGGYTHGQRGSQVPDSTAHGALNWDEPVEPGAFYRSVFKPALQAAHLPPSVRLHDLRHTYASLALTRRVASDATGGGIRRVA